MSPTSPDPNAVLFLAVLRRRQVCRSPADLPRSVSLG
jgi:hypothetical protein